MTSSGKVRIYELSRDLGLDNKDVLDAAEKLGVAAKSHSSSISDDEAVQIRRLLARGANGSTAAPVSGTQAPAKAILTVKKAAAPAPVAPAKPIAAQPSAAKPPAAKPAAVRQPAVTPPVAPPAAQKPAAPAPAKPQPPRAGGVKPQPIQPEAGRPAPADKPAPPQRPVPTPSGNAGRPLPPAKPASPARPGGAPARSAVSPAPPAIRPAAPRASAPPGRTAPPARPPVVIASKPTRPAAPAPTPSRKPDQPARAGASAGRPQLVGRPISAQATSNRPAPPAGRPPLSQRPGPQRPGGGSAASSGRPAQPGRPGPTPLELVGKPIRRDSSPAAGAGAGVGRPAAPGRPGMPAGMRKPVAPGQLMQLQKPSGRTPAPPPRRPGERGDGTTAPSTTPDLVRPTAAPPTAPRRPGARPGGAVGPAGRPRRPDWDDSAKLEALRSRSPQRQRPKVHIIGENDDALTAETGGYAGELEAIVLQASLARPAKPRSTPAAAAKPTVAVRKRKKETTRQRHAASMPATAITMLR